MKKFLCVLLAATLVLTGHGLPNNIVSAVDEPPEVVEINKKSEENSKSSDEEKTIKIFSWLLLIPGAWCLFWLKRQIVECMCMCMCENIIRRCQENNSSGHWSDYRTMQQTDFCELPSD